MVPQFPAPNRAQKFKVEASEDLQTINKKLEELKQAVTENTAGLSKKKADDLLGKVNSALRVVSDILPFVQEQFEEHMENVEEAAKAEVHGYLSHQITRLGLDAIGTKPEDVLMIDQKKDD